MPKIYANAMADPARQTCTGCRVAKPWSAFYRDQRLSTGFRRRCGKCESARVSARHQARRAEDPASARRRDKANNLWRDFRITLETFEAMRWLQDNRCLICNEPETKRELAVDHCHDTGKVRGLLCSGCNTGIGLLRHDTKRLASAVRYLEGAPA